MQNLAGLHEIAKISTRKMVAIPTSQNFELANNSNNKVNKLLEKSQLRSVPIFKTKASPFES